MDSQINPMNLTLRQLRGFVTVAELGGFTAAAKRLHLTQSALSSLVKELESSLGVRLFDRSTRKVVPTEPGREFLPFAVRVLQDIQDAAVRAGEIAASDRGVVRVAALELSSCTLLPEAIAAFQHQNPAIEVRLADTVLEQVLARLRLGEVDIGIGPEPAPDPELDRSALLSAPFMLVCRPDHHLAKKRYVRWDDLRAEHFITMIRNFRAQVMSGARGWPAGLEFASLREVALATTALGMVRAGLGVSVAPVYTARMVKGFDLVLRRLIEPVVSAELFVFTRRGRSLSPAARRFVSFLREMLAKHGPPQPASHTEAAS